MRRRLKTMVGFTLSTGPTEHWETVGICLNLLIYRKVSFLSTFFEKKCTKVWIVWVVCLFFYDVDVFEVSSPNQFSNRSDEPIGYVRYGTLLCSLYGAFMILYVGIICT